jgi:hypothetical protein
MIVPNVVPRPPAPLAGIRSGAARCVYVTNRLQYSTVRGACYLLPRILHLDLRRNTYIVFVIVYDAYVRVPGGIQDPLKSLVQSSAGMRAPSLSQFHL